MNKDRLRDVNPKAPRAGDRRRGGIDIHGHAGDLRLARPALWMPLRRILGGTVKSESRVALQVAQLERARHHSQEQLPVRELDLDAADSRRAVLAKRREGFVFPNAESFLDPASEGRLGRCEFAPAGHQSVPNHWRRMGYR